MKNIIFFVLGLVLLLFGSVACAQTVTNDEYLNAYFVIYTDYLGQEGKFTKEELQDIIYYYITNEDLSTCLNKFGPNSNKMIGTILADAGVGFDCGICEASTAGIKCCLYRVGQVPMYYECVGTEVMGVTSYSWRQLWQCTFGCCGTKCCLDASGTTVRPTTTTWEGSTTTMALTTTSTTASTTTSTKASASTTSTVSTTSTAASTTTLPATTVKPSTTTTTPSASTTTAASTTTTLSFISPTSTVTTTPSGKTCKDFDGQLLGVGQCSRVYDNMRCTEIPPLPQPGLLQDVTCKDNEGPITGGTICQDCCKEGLGCTVYCQGVGRKSITTPQSITACQYGGTTIVLNLGMAFSAYNCVNGKCASDGGNSTTTSSTVPTGASTTNPPATTTH